MQPRTEGLQRCRSFTLTVQPRVSVASYQDYLGNTIHHFDVPRPHTQLLLTAEGQVEVQPMPAWPEALPEASWDALDGLMADGMAWDCLQPSRFVQFTPRLDALADELAVARMADPLTVLRTLTRRLYEAFAYEPMSTHVESPIDEAIAARRGVCQDFSHIMAALVRRLGIPCRYVSGYLFHREIDQDRSVEDASHAWVEALLPGLGWVGFDPTNNLMVGERHIRVAVGRDYDDVPPTRGVFKGQAEEAMSVGVRVTRDDAPALLEADLPPEPTWEPLPPGDREEAAWAQQQ